MSITATSTLLRVLLVSAFGLVVTCACGVTNLVLSQTTNRAVEVDTFQVEHYDLKLRIDATAKTLTGAVTMLASARSAGLTTVALDLFDNMQVSSVTGSEKPLIFAHSNNRLSISLATPLKIGEKFSVTIKYQGTPAGRAFIFGERRGVPMVFTYGMPRSAMRWWPCDDRPMRKAASVSLAITIPTTVITSSGPQSMIAASNGRLVQQVANPDGTTTFDWQVSYPIYPDVVSLAVTNYSTFTLPYNFAPARQMPLNFFAFPEDLEKAKVDFGSVPEIMKFYATVFGEYPFIKEKYGIAEIPPQTFREHQTLPSYGANFITGDHKNEQIVAHDLAHQWFGNFISVKSWSHIWLNEGFSNYAYALWRESVGGRIAYQAAMNELDDSPLSGPVFIQDPANFGKLFGSDTFNKGAWVLHMLRHVMGEKKFFQALRLYLKTYGFKSADTEDFQAICEKVNGAPLGWFFMEWIYGTGRPEFNRSWEVVDEGRKRIVKLTIEQKQEGNSFQMPVDVVIKTASGTKTFVVRMNSKSQVFDFEVNEPIHEVQLDPERWILSGKLPSQLTN